MKEKHFLGGNKLLVATQPMLIVKQSQVNEQMNFPII